VNHGSDPDAGAADPGLADKWERLWTPHRMAYLRGENRPSDSDAGQHCPFCRIPAGTDAEGLVLARGEHVYVVLNLYPYNSGHLLICPYRHVADYTELSHEETQEFSDFTKRSVAALTRCSAPHGFNIGMNQGAVAGAGIAAHLHQHVVPRWGGDSNFMPVIGRTKTLPQLLEETRDLLAQAWI
jgi:ATP adenylyltransferase